MIYLEIWKDIKGFEGFYQISNIGRVKSLRRFNAKGNLLKEKVIHSGINAWGYKVITLHKNCYRKSILIHRLVAEAFIDNPYNKSQVNHKSGDKQDNRITNLEWCTGSENMIHAYKTGLKKLPIGELNPNNKLSITDKHKIRKLKIMGFKVNDIMFLYGISQSEVYKINKTYMKD